MHGKHLFRRIVALGMAVLMLALTCGCEKKYEKAVALAEPATSGSSAGVQQLTIDETFVEAYRLFSYLLFNLAHEDAGGSFAVSPISMMLALAMVENGASGETLLQMEKMFGMPKDLMNRYLASFINTCSADNGLNIADSIWIQEAIADTAKQSYLDVCAQVYRASVFKAPLDETTVRDVNTWVSKNTDGMIKELLEQLTPGLRMLLVNTVLFNRDWEQPFEKSRTEKNADFFGEDGEVIGTVDLMRECENGTYYRDDLCTSVAKYYDDNNSSFLIFQPREGVSLENLINALSPAYMRKVLDYENRHRADITLELPRFTTDYTSRRMEDVLRKMGMNNAFEGGLTEILDKRELRIDFVIHKVRVEVDEEGTRAAAATAIGLKESAVEPAAEQITVRLDRPFVYMIMDGNGIPLFLGTYEG